MTQRFTAPAMSCAHCKKRIEGALAALEGVESCEADPATKIVRVEGRADSAAILAALSEAGYEASPA